MGQIIITVDKNGQYIIEASGYTGNSCEMATLALETALGKVEQRDYKPEYHSSVTVQNNTQIQQ